MYNKDYRDYLSVLRAREARPPFEQMAKLVTNAPARSTAAIPLFAKFAGVLAIGSIVVGGAWMLSAKHPVARMLRTINPVNTGPSLLFYESLAPYGSLSRKLIPTKSNKLQFTTPTEALPPVQHTPTTDHLTVLIQPCAIREVSSSVPSIGSPTVPVPLIGVPRSNKETTGSIVLTVGGAIGQQFSPNAAYRQLSFSDAFLGIGYSLSQNASIRILAGEEVFSAPSSQTTNSISFDDTTIGSYKNMLGEIQSVNVPTLTRVYWLGGSYRYTLSDLSNNIRPFAELMAGGSTDGFLTHQSLGAEFTATSNIDLDLLFEASELLPQNSSWLTKAGLSAAMEFHW